jgi:hypothetical protein
MKNVLRFGSRMKNQLTKELKKLQRIALSHLVNTIQSKHGEKQSWVTENTHNPKPN